VQIWRSWDDVPDDLGRTAVVIGNFDGVHLGHRRVLSRARAVADERGLQLVAVTFDPHPMAVLRPEHAPVSLTSLETRAALLGGAGADAVLAATVFHFGTCRISEVKASLAAAGHPVR
jgi:riboflavin kinase/FMN adenylyltransferase